MKEQTRIVFRKCPQCDFDNSETPRLSYAPPEWSMKKCRQCGFVYLEKAPAYEEMAANFAWERDDKRAPEQQRFAQTTIYDVTTKSRRLMKRIFQSKKIPDLVVQYAEPGKVLDIGCGDGNKLIDLPAGYIPNGIEISRELCRKARLNFEPRGGQVVNAPALEGLSMLPSDTFTAIVMRAYLEHEINPKQVLGEVLGTLTPNGVAFIKVPNIACVNRKIIGRRWCGFIFPDHVNYFTPASLGRMVLDCGFCIRDFSFMRRLPTSDNMWIVISKRDAE